MKKAMWIFFAMFIVANSWSATITEETTTTTKKKVVTNDPSPKPTPYPFWVEVVGANPMTIMKGSTFTDPGAIAHGPRKVDGPIKMFTTDKVDANVTGSVTIVYSRVNRLGKTIKATRVVTIVEAKPSPSPSPTATKVASKKKPTKKFADRWLQVSWEQHVLDRVSESELPNGFSVNTWANVGQRFSVQVHPLKSVALKFAIDSTKTSEELKVFGSSLGRVVIGDSWEFVGKFYPQLSKDVFLFVGAGVRHSHLEGNYSVGGYAFNRVGDGWSPVVEWGVDIPISNWLAATACYQMTSLDLVTEVPFTVDIKTNLTGNVNFGLVMRPF
ncbi:MAG: DUF5011 domain-containing protein [Bacteroidales bacterium]|nr:DUF5011 domain-containing protein [Bacteroidales bacterium]